LASLQDFARHAFILFVGGGESDESTEIDKKKEMMFLPLLFTAYPFPKVRSTKKKEKKRELLLKNDDSINT